MSESLEAIGMDCITAASWAKILTEEETRELVREVDTTATVNAQTLARILATKNHGDNSHENDFYSYRGLSTFIEEQLLCGALGVPPIESSTFVDEETTRLPVKCLKHVLRLMPYLGTEYRQRLCDRVAEVAQTIKAMA